MDRIVDISLPEIGVGREKALMRREAADVEAASESPPLESLEIAFVLALHLAVEQLDAIEAHFGRQIDALLDVAVLATVELPEGIRADGNAIARGACRARRL